MKILLMTLPLLMLAFAPATSRADDEEGGDSEAPAGTAAAPNEEAPSAPDGGKRPARPAYTAPVIRSNSNYRVQEAAPAPAAPEEPEEDEARSEEPKPRRETQPVHRELSSPAAQGAKASGGGGGSCPAAPKKVRSYTLEGSGIASYCKGQSCAKAVTLKHGLYPTVIKVGEIADFMERCDFRDDTPCPVPGGYQDKASLGANSVYMGVPPGGTAGPGTPQTLVPIVGIAPRYQSYDLSIPFEIDPRMKGRSLMMTYAVNSNNNTGMHLSVSECEGDFSRRAVLLQEGDMPNYTVVVTQGAEGSARDRAGTKRTILSLKAGKRYYLNIRRVLKAALDTPTDSLSDDEIHPYVLARQFSRDGMLAQEFPRLSWMAYPAGATGTLTESEAAAKPGFRGPGQGL